MPNAVLEIWPYEKKVFLDPFIMQYYATKNCGTNLKGMTLDQDFGYSFSPSSSLLKKREEEKKNELAKIVIKVHSFQTSQTADKELNRSYLMIID